MVSVLKNRIRIISIVIENKYLKTLLSKKGIDEGYDVTLNSFWMSNMDKYSRKFKYKTFAKLAQKLLLKWFIQNG